MYLHEAEREDGYRWEGIGIRLWVKNKNWLIDSVTESRSMNRRWINKLSTKYLRCPFLCTYYQKPPAEGINVWKDKTLLFLLTWLSENDEGFFFFSFLSKIADGRQSNNNDNDKKKNPKTKQEKQSQQQRNKGRN